MLNVNKYVRLAFYTKNHISKFVISVKPHHPKSWRSEKKENIIYHVHTCSKTEIILSCHLRMNTADVTKCYNHVR